MQDPGQPGAKFVAALVDASYLRIHDHLLRTPLKNDAVEGIRLKCENLQTTGSFKWRGALSRLSLLPKGSKVITASTGNHGLGVSTAAAIYEQVVTVFLPDKANARKKEKLKKLGVELKEVKGDSLAAELAGKAYAKEHHATWVSPYNDLGVIAGQGTIGKEILEQINTAHTTNKPDYVDKIYITIGGGGLVSGIASYFHLHAPNTEIIGCQPVNSAEMFLSQLAGHVVMAPEELATLSDGSAGPLEEDSITFGLCRTLVDRYILVNEDEIRSAIRDIYKNHEMVIEGAAGVAYAAALSDAERKDDDRAVVVLCGGNIDPNMHREICD
jgi:threonine dehydratase